MRSVHILRDDHRGHLGGDLHQLLNGVRALRDAGVDAIAADWTDAPAETDIIHLYNLWLPLQLHRQYVMARRRWPGAKIVVSPVFWTWPGTRILDARDHHLLRTVAKSAVKTWSTWPLCRRVLKGADAVLPLSERELQIVAGYFRLHPRPSWRVVHNGIWLDDWPMRRERFTPAIASELKIDPTAQLIVACIGGIYPNKNQRNVIRAVANLKGSALLLVGPNSDHTYAQAIFDLADRLLPGRWSWLGKVSHERLRGILAWTDISVLPSFREVVGLVNLEAAACGCEVVVSSRGGIREYLGDAAHMCEPQDINSITKALESARENPKQPRARRRAEEFDWSRTGREVAAAYEFALSAS